MNTQYNSSYIFSITLVATLGGLLFGYDTAVISGTVESLNTVFVAPQNLSESPANSLLGFCVASALIGASSVVPSGVIAVAASVVVIHLRLLLSCFLFLV